MSTLQGLLNLEDSERAYVTQVGQALVFDAVNQVLADHNEEVSRAASIFIERETENFAMRYLLAGGGELQRLGTQAPAAAVKRDGHYDVGFPLRGWGAQLAGSRVAMAYMTVAELDAHLKTIKIQDINTLRRRILTSLFESTNLTFTDPVHGAITVRRLANVTSGATDNTLYPPVVGSETEATDDHYIGLNAAVDAIADGATDPTVILRDEIAEHFGGVGAVGKNFVYFHANDQTAYIQALTGFVETTDIFTTPGNDTATVAGWPNVPGMIHGRVNGVWCSEWDGWIPDLYGLMILLGVPAPLIMRRDPAVTGLGSGLQLVAKDGAHPLESAHYENRYGLGCGNRLSAACIKINSSTTWASPSGYAE